MRNNFWSIINRINNKPYLLLAPMAGYTDQSFRIMCKKYGADVTYSEMVSSEALFHNASKLKMQNEKLKIKVLLRNNLYKTLKLIQFSQVERPYVVQIFGSDPEHMAYAAEFIASGEWAKTLSAISSQLSDKFKIINLKLKIESIPDGIDVNMGCPVKDVTSSGAGAALMKNPDRAVGIIKAIKKQVKNIPVSVKTRLGWSDHDEILDFSKKIEDAGADVIAIHGRTKKEGFSGTADWKMIGKVKKQLSIPVIGNGGIGMSYQPSAISHQLDGLMIGTGALGHPWIFEKIKNHPFDKFRAGKLKIKNNVSLWDDYKDIKFIKQNILEHAKLYRDLKGDDFVEFRKQLVWYFTGLKGAKEARKMAVKVEKYQDIVKMCEKL